MTINELIILAENRLSFLNQIMTNAVQIGDVAEINRLEEEIRNTQTTLDSLRKI